MPIERSTISRVRAALAVIPSMQRSRSTSTAAVRVASDWKSE